MSRVPHQIKIFHQLLTGRVIPNSQTQQLQHPGKKTKTKRFFTNLSIWIPMTSYRIPYHKRYCRSIAGRKTISSNNRLYYIVRKKKEWVMINDYNPVILLTWNGNIDIQFVGEKQLLELLRNKNYNKKRKHIRNRYV